MSIEYTAIKLVKRPEINITPDLFEVVTLTRGSNIDYS